MLEIDIPSVDPIRHEPRLIFGMTLRQAICGIAGIGIGVVVFVALKSFAPQLAAVALILSVVPAAMIGWFKPYNMRFEQFIKLYISNRINPSKRVYRTRNDAGVDKIAADLKDALEESGDEPIRSNEIPEPEDGSKTEPDKTQDGKKERRRGGIFAKKKK